MATLRILVSHTDVLNTLVGFQPESPSLDGQGSVGVNAGDNHTGLDIHSFLQVLLRSGMMM